MKGPYPEVALNDPGTNSQRVRVSVFFWWSFCWSFFRNSLRTFTKQLNTLFGILCSRTSMSSFGALLISIFWRWWSLLWFQPFLLLRTSFFLIVWFIVFLANLWLISALSHRSYRLFSCLLWPLFERHLKISYVHFLSVFLLRLSFIISQSISLTSFHS